MRVHESKFLMVFHPDCPACKAQRGIEKGYGSSISHFHTHPIEYKDHVIGIDGMRYDMYNSVYGTVKVDDEGIKIGA